MDQHDQELLEKQLRAINGAPPRAGVITVTMLMAFVAGMTLGSLLAGPASEPTRVAANDVAPNNVAPPMPHPGGAQWTMR
jgi:hypothetical protein